MEELSRPSAAKVIDELQVQISDAQSMKVSRHIGHW